MKTFTPFSNRENVPRENFDRRRVLIFSLLARNLIKFIFHRAVQWMVEARGEIKLKRESEEPVSRSRRAALIPHVAYNFLRYSQSFCDWNL